MCCFKFNSGDRLVKLKPKAAVLLPPIAPQPPSHPHEGRWLTKVLRDWFSLSSSSNDSRNGSSSSTTIHDDHCSDKFPLENSCRDGGRGIGGLAADIGTDAGSPTSVTSCSPDAQNVTNNAQGSVCSNERKLPPVGKCHDAVNAVTTAGVTAAMETVSGMMAPSIPTTTSTGTTDTPIDVQQHPTNFATLESNANTLFDPWDPTMGSLLASDQREVMVTACFRVDPHFSFLPDWMLYSVLKSSAYTILTMLDWQAKLFLPGCVHHHRLLSSKYDAAKALILRSHPSDPRVTTGAGSKGTGGSVVGGDNKIDDNNKKKKTRSLLATAV